MPPATASAATPRPTPAPPSTHSDLRLLTSRPPGSLLLTPGSFGYRARHTCPLQPAVPVRHLVQVLLVVVLGVVEGPRRHDLRRDRLLAGRLERTVVLVAHRLRHAPLLLVRVIDR